MLYVTKIVILFFVFPLQTILLGDSGVGKTSFLVQYHTGDFKLGSFSATVGIALTVSTQFFLVYLIFYGGLSFIWMCALHFRTKLKSIQPY